MAFAATYASTGAPLAWSKFLAADFDRWTFIHDHLLVDFAISPALGASLAAGLISCALAAMIRAPFMRAVAGPHYPLAPRSWGEVYNLAGLYVLSSLLVKVFPVAAFGHGVLEQFASIVALIAAVLLIFTDYVIIYEQLPLHQALKRGVRLVGRRWAAVLLIFVIIQFVWFGFYALYSLYYEGTQRIFFLLPISKILFEAVLILFIDLVLIYFYEGVRSAAPLKDRSR
ncbi:MAG: hypothetical protein N3B14_09035 [Thermoleophilia bacterium]|nr:hypothetical protein [Thermoleophilia bacterium]